ncbi:MAG: PQQ-dependent sugar dehydrogenase [Planctomycetaceae bacterium]|nr:PQQ-dependent sugar dehydrogenase [Planctomycetaceae bacterium]
MMYYREFRVRWLLQAAVLLSAVTTFGLILEAADESTSGHPVWSASAIVGSPEPPPAFRQVRRYPQLKFDQPLYIESGPDHARIWVIDRAARIWSFPDRDDVASADLFVDLKSGFSELTKHDGASGVATAYGLALHPDFPEVPFCWITYTLQSRERGQHLEDGTRLSRFRIDFNDDGIPVCDVTSEQVLLSWLEGGHNGACVRFGPDGYLYVSAGDGEAPNPPDPRRAGQDVTNVLSTIMRLEVSTSEDGPLYTIPHDNPFAATANVSASAEVSEPATEDLTFSAAEARPEIWAYGFRNPWKMNFGPDGQLWVGDVGWEMYEMVYNVKPGGNYGWSIMEGPQPVLPSAKRGPTPILSAAYAYSHAEGASVTGGFIYQGKSFPELSGRYVFGDFETRRIWSAVVTPSSGSDADTLTNVTDLVDPSVRIVAFGEDTSGELLLLHFDEGTIYGLQRNESAEQSSEFPRRLSQTGIFRNTDLLEPSEGVLPFRINHPMWSDGAVGTYVIGIPSPDPIHVLKGPRRRPESILRESMEFPANSVLAKTIELKDDLGHSVRLETQILHFNGNVWNPYSYVWNRDQSDAELAPTAGQTLNLSDYGTFGSRTSWTIHSRSECLRCHNSWIGGPLAFTLPQLNRDASDGRSSAALGSSSASNQLSQFVSMRLLDGTVPADPTRADDARLRPLVAANDSTASVSDRARSYLAVNCSHCHQNGAGGTATIDLRREIPVDEMKVVSAAPAQGSFQIANASIISSGMPARSVLLYRMACMGRGRMPHIGSEQVDVNGVELLREWIASMPAVAGSEEVVHRSGENALMTTEAAMEIVHQLDCGEIAAREREAILELAKQSSPEVHNLFLRFQSAEYQAQIQQPLDVTAILNTTGRASDGAALFADRRLQCTTCHRIANQGGQVGPALDSVGRRLTKTQILDSIINPSSQINPEFATWTIVSTDGRVLSGLLVERTDDHISLRTVRNETTVVPRSDVEEFIRQTTSLMPDRLLAGLTTQQIADLLAYLAVQQAAAEATTNQ